MLPRAVIVGGGFGGLSAVRALRNAPVSVTLIDKRNYHLFRPMLYRVATGLLSADEIESHRLLRAIHRLVVRADTIGERRTPAARLIATARIFDLDHARAEIGEHLRTQRPGEDTGEIGDDDAVEGTLHR